MVNIKCYWTKGWRAKLSLSAGVGSGKTSCGEISGLGIRGWRVNQAKNSAVPGGIKGLYEERPRGKSKIWLGSVRI